MTVVRERVWAYLREHCSSFASMTADAVFSDIFTLNTVGVMTQELESLFLIQAPLSLHHNQFENYVSEAVLPNSRTLYCELCEENFGDISMLRHVVTLPTFLIAELSSNCIDKIFFPLTMDVLGEYYVGSMHKSSFHSGFKV